jgi:hypothetical protein
VLSEIPENQRPIAELALQGMQTVRQRLKEANAALAAEGKPTMPEQSVLQMAENLLPRLRVADWLDRAEAAKRDLAHLDLRDLRSIVAAANDAVIERSDACRELVAEMKAGLTARTEEEYQNWLADIDANLGVGRIVRALKLAGQPPKAGAIFPVELGRRLADAATSNHLEARVGPGRTHQDHRASGHAVAPDRRGVRDRGRNRARPQALAPDAPRQEAAAAPSGTTHGIRHDRTNRWFRLLRVRTDGANGSGRARRLRRTADRRRRIGGRIRLIGWCAH